MSLTILSHFYNEEYLLPWWLKHHREIADHGILIDYASTDRSVEIIRECCPTWEIIPSRNEFFGAAECDAEVMDIEKRVSGYKIALNTTEFLYCDPDFPLDFPLAASIQSVVMVDKEPTERALRGLPLDWQCHTGYFTHDVAPVSTATWGRDRIIHRLDHGAYLPGRHASHLDVAPCPTDALILWYGFAPWTPQFRYRKLQIQQRMSEYDRIHGYGIQHVIGDVGLNEAWETAKPWAYDLRTDVRYRRVVG